MLLNICKTVISMRSFHPWALFSWIQKPILPQKKKEILNSNLKKKKKKNPDLGFVVLEADVS